jgi:hypothetical protein
MMRHFASALPRKKHGMMEEKPTIKETTNPRLLQG